jgi:hypothetical protein
MVLVESPASVEPALVERLSVGTVFLPRCQLVREPRQLE